MEIPEISCRPAVSSAVSLLTFQKGDPGSIPGRVTPEFCMWESCRTMPLVSGFSRGSPVSLPFHSGTAPYSLQSPSSDYKTSLLRAAKTSPLFLYRRSVRESAVFVEVGATVEIIPEDNGASPARAFSVIRVPVSSKERLFPPSSSFNCIPNPSRLYPSYCTSAGFTSPILILFQAGTSCSFSFRYLSDSSFSVKTKLRTRLDLQLDGALITQ
ncbi:hypothetical protein PR048_020971, partial [Dryococelus australis]